MKKNIEKKVNNRIEKMALYAKFVTADENIPDEEALKEESLFEEQPEEEEIDEDQLTEYVPQDPLREEPDVEDDMLDELLSKPLEDEEQYINEKTILVEWQDESEGLPDLIRIPRKLWEDYKEYFDESIITDWLEEEFGQEPISFQDYDQHTPEE